MYTSIRRYKTKSAAEVTRRVNEQFVPLIKGIPGLVAYYLVNSDHGTMTSVSVFETQEGQEESNRVAASWVKQGLGELVGPVEISAGEQFYLAWQLRGYLAESRFSSSRLKAVSSSSFS